MHPATVALLLVIRSYDIFGVSASDLGVAKRTAAHILRQAGIDLLWIDCSASAAAPAAPGCTEVPRSDELLVRIVAAPIDHQREIIGHDTLGYAYVDTATGRGSLATLYPDRIAALARQSGIDVATLLGRAMAHEIGHLLLGTPTHPPRGLMRAEWSLPLLQRRFVNDWLFSPGEIKRLAENLEVRSYHPTCLPLSCSSSQVFSGAK